MIPKINNRGHSFKGVVAYLMHDKEAQTAERIEWTHTGNMHTDDIEKAALVMAWTDKNAEALKQLSGGSLAGRKPEAGGVYHYSLAWSHDEQPNQEHMQAQALETLQRLGLDKHEYFVVAHNDTKHTHLHVVANLTNPKTGQRLTPSFDKRELQSWALEYEREHGIKCEMREENAAKREQGENVKYRDTKQDYSDRVTRAFYAADDGKAFVHSLEHENLHLAKGRSNDFLIVDENGDIQKLARQLDIELKGKKKKAAINGFLGGIDGDSLPDADELAKQIKQAKEDQEREIKEQLEKEKEQEKERLEEAELLQGEAEEADAATQEKQNTGNAEEAAAQDQHTDRDKYEAEQRDKTEAAALAHSEAVETAAALVADLDKLNIPRYSRLKQSKAEWSELKEAQTVEKAELLHRLHKDESEKEKAHRAHWQEIIDTENGHQRSLEKELRKKGFRAFVNRMLHGEDMKAEHVAREKNIQNAQMRLADGVGILSSTDKYSLMKLDKSHQHQRDELRREIDEDLHSLEDTRKEVEHKLIQEAASSPERAAALKNAINTNSAVGKKAAAEIESIERSYKQQSAQEPQGMDAEQSQEWGGQENRNKLFKDQNQEPEQDQGQDLE